jgi:hypothetical protein
VENGTLAYGSQAQWYGYVLHESGCLKGNDRPLSMAATSTRGGEVVEDSFCV